MPDVSSCWWVSSPFIGTVTACKPAHSCIVVPGGGLQLVCFTHRLGLMYCCTCWCVPLAVQHHHITNITNCHTRIKNPFCRLDISHWLRKQSILLSGKLSDDEFDIRYFSAGLKLGWVILSWMGGVIVSQNWQKITFLQLSGLKLTFSEQLSWRKVSNNY